MGDGWRNNVGGACLNKKLTDKNNFPRYMAFLFDISNSAGKKDEDSWKLKEVK